RLPQLTRRLHRHAGDLAIQSSCLSLDGQIFGDTWCVFSAEKLSNDALAAAVTVELRIDSDLRRRSGGLVADADQLVVLLVDPEAFHDCAIQVFDHGPQLGFYQAAHQLIAGSVRSY